MKNKIQENKLNTKISNAAKWSTLGELIAKCITPLTNMILARILAPEAFGVITTITMIISFTDMFTDAGFQKYLIQHEFIDERDKEESINVAFWTNLILSVSLWIFIIIFRNHIAYAVGNPGLGNVIAIACIQLPLMSFSSIQMALYRRELDFKTLFIRRLITIIIPFVITIPLAIIGLSYWSMVIGSICSAFTNAIIMTMKSKWKPKFIYSFNRLKEMISFSGWTLCESITIWLTTWVDALIIGSTFSEYYLGLYKNSLNMVNSLMAIVTASVFPILFSVLSRLQNDEVKYKRVYYDTQRLVTYIVLPMGVGLFIFRDLATGIILGEKWSEASNIVGIWSLMAVIGIIFSNFNGEVYRSKGRPKLSFVYQIIHLLFLIPTCLVAIQYDFWALVYSRALIRLQGTITGFIFMKIFMKFSIRDMIKNILKPFLCTSIMALFAIILRNHSQSILSSLVSILICIGVYLTTLVMIARRDMALIGDFINIKSKVKGKSLEVR